MRAAGHLRRSQHHPAGLMPHSKEPRMGKVLGLVWFDFEVTLE